MSILGRKGLRKGKLSKILTDTDTRSTQRQKICFAVNTVKKYSAFDRAFSDL